MSAPVYWAQVKNNSSQRWHAFGPDNKAICGVPWEPMRDLAEKKYPGHHVACSKCRKIQGH